MGKLVKKKEKRRYELTATIGLTKKLYVPVKHHKKLPEVARIYNKHELEEFAKARGWTVSKSVK